MFSGDIIETTLQSDDIYHFKQVIERAPLQHYSWVVPSVFVNSPEYSEYGAAVEEAGGTWEGIFGGSLLVHVPNNSTFDADAELDRSLAAARRKRATRWWQFLKKDN